MLKPLTEAAIPSSADTPGVGTALAELAGSLSNALRDPLAPICSAVHLLRRKRRTDPEQERWLEILERQSDRLAALADELVEIGNLAQSRQCIQTRELDVATLVSRALEGCQEHLHAYGQTVHIELPERALLVQGDARGLVLVLKVLVHQAIRYAPPGSEILLVVTSLGPALEIRVHDSVCGMINELRELLPNALNLCWNEERHHARFPFESGIGLALARQMIGLHGGRLEVRGADPDAGREFVIRLPLAQPGYTIVANQRGNKSNIRCCEANM